MGCSDVVIVGGGNKKPTQRMTRANLKGEKILTPPGDQFGNTPGKGPLKSDIDANLKGAKPPKPT
jgi:hypothetical protein